MNTRAMPFVCEGQGQFIRCSDESPMEHGWNLFIFTALLGFVMMVPLMFTLLGWFSTSMEVDTALNATTEPSTEAAAMSTANPSGTSANPVEVTGNSYTVAVDTPLGPGEVTVFTGARSSNESVPIWGGVDESGMPRFSTAFELPALGDAWSPEAMIAWMYERCARRHGIAATDERRQLYAERMAVLRGVMQGCRSTDAEVRLEASRMTRSMTDISEDENSPSYRLSTSEFCTTLDEAERAVSVGQQLVDTIGSASASSNPTAGSAAASSAHVNAVADAMIRMLSAENPEEETSESDAAMETQSERARRYGSSELCEVSDPDEWMLYHHGPSDSEDSEAS